MTTNQLFRRYVLPCSAFFLISLLSPAQSWAAVSPREIQSQVKAAVRERQLYNQVKPMENPPLPPAPTQPTAPPVPSVQAVSATSTDVIPVQLRPVAPTPAASTSAKLPDQIFWSIARGSITLHRRDGQLYLSLFKHVALPNQPAPLSS